MSEVVGGWQNLSVHVDGIERISLLAFGLFELVIIIICALSKSVLIKFMNPL
jgi:hypothetical protein